MGCADNTVAPCDLWTASAVVSGHVTDGSGAPVPNATVEIRVTMADSCDEPDEWVLSQVTTDANGNYSAEVHLGNTRGIRCVSVTEVASHTSARGQVEFVGGCEETRPAGQLNLDLVIP